MKKPLEKWNSLLEEWPIPSLAVLAVVTELVIELLGHRNPLNAFVFIAKSPHMFLLNAAIIFSTLMFAMLLRRKVFYSILVTFLWVACGIVNWATLSFRTTPFSARDFSILASGLLIADVYFSPLEIIGICAAVAVCTLLLFLLFTRAPRCGKQKDIRKSLVTVGGLALALFIVGFFGTKHIKLSAQYESINQAFEKRGFPYCFASSIFKSGVSRPENYSKEKINALGVKSAVGAEKKPNIILVQLESFFDPALIKGVEIAENPIPNFTSLRDSCASGYLYMPTLGAGTVNAEFEVLTGMNLDFFGIGEYPYESILRDNTCESVAYYLKELDYKTHVVHNYTGSFYGRNEVYPNLGFDDFTSVEYMHDVERNEKGWPKDTVLTQYVLQAMEQTEEPDLVFTVSVQCHGKYPTDAETDGIELQGNEVFEGSASEKFKYFVKQLGGTDQFIGELIEALRDYDEDVVVVAYGDHLPTLGLTEDDLVNGTLFQTQYFVWSNYGVGLGGADRDISAYQLTTRLFELIGMDGGVVTTYHREHMGLEGYQDGLETLEYDLLYGDKIAYGGESPYKKTDMKMGLEEITVTGKNFGGTAVEIQGSGFTEYSAVYINEKRNEDFIFISSESLLVPDPLKTLTEDDLIEVCQTGPDRKILSTARDLSK